MMMTSSSVLHIISLRLQGRQQYFGLTRKSCAFLSGSLYQKLSCRGRTGSLGLNRHSLEEDRTAAKDVLHILQCLLLRLCRLYNTHSLNCMRGQARTVDDDNEASVLVLILLSRLSMVVWCVVSGTSNAICFVVVVDVLVSCRHEAMPVTATELNLSCCLSEL